jgi:DNA invertase Pin-like site-specific DNA recombinase
MKREDAVYVRKSSDPQEEASQIGALRDYLDRQQIHVPQHLWFIDTGSRAKPEEREAFQRLLKLVRAGKISRVFIWKPDRFTVGVTKWFATLNDFQESHTQLIEILTGKDLASDDLETEITATFKARQGKDELYALAENVMRARGSMARKGIPVSKWAPYGFDKRITDASGLHLWTVHLLDSKKWLVINPDGSTVERASCPRKSKTDLIQYVHGRDPNRLKVIVDIFTAFATEAITERGIAVRLNTLGQLHYGKPWLRTTIHDILRNPAYIGCVRNLNTTQAEYATDDGAKVVRLTHPPKTRTGKIQTRKGNPIIVEDRHEPVISRDIWDTVQRKLDTKTSRPQPPRRDDLWLRGVLVCAKCRKSMHIFSVPKKAKQGYICASYYRYNQTHSEKDNTGCTRNWVSHAAAEKLITDRLGRLVTDSHEGDELSRLRRFCGIGEKELEAALLKGVMDYIEFVRDIGDKTGTKINVADLARRTLDLKAKGKADIKDKDLRGMIEETVPSPLNVATYRKFFLAFEEQRVDAAKAHLAKLNADYDRWLAAKVDATTDREKERHTAKLREIEAELEKWEGLTVPLDEQLAAVRSRVVDHHRQLADAVKALAGSANLRKAEIVRQFFKAVVLHFDPVPKAKIRDCVFRPELTEFVDNLDDGSSSPARRASSLAGSAIRCLVGSR